MLFPLVYSFYISFENFSLARPNETSFAGLQNYVAMATLPSFLGALWNTIVFTIGAVVLEFLLGLGFAILMNREFPGQGIVRTCLMLPLFLTPAIVALEWLFLLSPR